MLVLQFGSIRQSLTSLSSILLGLIILASCTFGGSFESYMTSGKAALAKKDYNAAVIQFKNAAQKNPTDAEARYLLATAYIEAGNFPAAEKELRQAKQFKFDAGKISATLGKALLHQTKFRELLDEIQPEPGYAASELAEIFVSRGLAYLAIAQYAEARASFQQAQKLAPQLASADLGMVQVLAGERKFAEALALNKQVLAKHPSYELAWGVQADLLAGQPQLEQAVAAYRKAIELEPRYFMAHAKLASLLLDMQQLDKAQVEVEELKKISPAHYLTHHLQARIHFLKRNYAAAEESIQEALKSDANHPPSLLLAGVIAQARGSNEQAEKHLSAVLANYPNHTYARKLLAAVQLKLGRAQTAVATLNPLVDQAAPDSGALLLAGEAYRLQGDNAKAVEYLEKAATIDPKNALIQTQLGLSYMAAGDNQAAVAKLGEASSLDPEQHKADTMLVMSHLNRKEYDKALAAVEALEKKLKNNPLTHSLRGTAYFGKNDFANARASFEQALAINPAFFPAAASLAQLDLRDKKPDIAQKRFERVLEKDKNSLSAMMALAKLASAKKAEKEYVAWLQKAMKAHPTAMAPRSALAGYYLSKDQPQPALALANETVNANPDNPEALNMLGATQMAAGDKANAIATFTKLTRLADQSAQAHQLLAMALIADKKFGEARASLQKALQLQPDNIQSQNTLITLELTQNKPDAALKVARQMQARQPASPVGFEREGDVQVAQKQFPAALKAYKLALDKGSSTPGFIKLHRAHVIANQTAVADQLLSDWLKQHAGDKAALAYAADYYVFRGQNKAAIAIYENVLRDAPDNAVILNNLASLYQREKDNRALPTAEQALKLAPENPGVQDTVGWILVEQGQAKRGLALLRGAATKAPTVPSFQYHYAAALAKTGDKLEARAVLEKLLAQPANFPEADAAKALLKGL